MSAPSPGSGDRLPLRMVLGAMRSGTNALHRCLSLDPRVSGYNEAGEDEFHVNWRLRPEPEIRPLLRAIQNTVLLKPIQNVRHVGLTDIFDEFGDYELKVAWIYRDPVNVFASAGRHWPDSRLADPEFFCADWNLVNARGLEALERHAGEVAVVRYEDLAADYGVFKVLCAFMDIRGVYLFRTDSDGGRRSLSDGLRRAVEAGTSDTLAALDAARLAVPEAPGEEHGRAVEELRRLEAEKADLEQRILDLKRTLA